MRKPFEFLSGLAVFLVIAIAIYSLLRLQFAPPQLLKWLIQSVNPPAAIFFFSGLGASGIVFAIRIGLILSPVEKVIPSERLRTYLSGLPLWAVLLLGFFSSIGLYRVFPTCRPPESVTFSVSAREQVFLPSDTLSVHPNETLVVTAATAEKDTLLSCQWQYVGSVFRRLGNSNACEITLEIANAPGDGYLTLQTSQNFCSQSSLFSLRMISETP